jgi:hypothetical protein
MKWGATLQGLSGQWLAAKSEIFVSEGKVIWHEKSNDRRWCVRENSIKS